MFAVTAPLSARAVGALFAAFALAVPATGCGGFEEEEPQVKKKGGGKTTGEVAQVGDKLTLKGTTYQVTDATASDTIGSGFTKEQANGEFVVVKVLLTNEKDEPATILEPNLVLISGNDKEYSVSDDALLAVKDAFLLEEIQPDVTEKGTLVYDVPPKAVNGSKLQVEDLFSGSTGQIDLGL